MLDRYLSTRSITDAEGFRVIYDILGAQRNIKILGVFTRLRDRDCKAGYVERHPRLWAYIDRNFKQPALAPVRAWFEANVPPSARAAAWQ